MKRVCSVRRNPEQLIWFVFIKINFYFSRPSWFSGPTRPRVNVVVLGSNPSVIRFNYRPEPFEPGETGYEKNKNKIRTFYLFFLKYF